MRIALPAACGLVLWCAPMPAHAAELKAAGATFPYPIYAKWFEAFSVRHAEVNTRHWVRRPASACCGRALWISPHPTWP